MPRSTPSRSGAQIRLTEERWAHICGEHPEMAALQDEVLEAIAGAEFVCAGHGGEQIAVRELDSGKAIVAVYRQTSPSDGFVITAFQTRRIESLRRRDRLWPPRN